MTTSKPEWQDISTAPYAMCVLAARFDEDAGEWVMQVVLSPPIRPFTHWTLLPSPPTNLPTETPVGEGM